MCIKYIYIHMTQQLHSEVYTQKNLKQDWNRYLYVNFHKNTIQIAKTWKEPNYPSIDEWISTMW